MFLLCYVLMIIVFFFFKQKTAYELRISDWSSDVCSSDLRARLPLPVAAGEHGREPRYLPRRRHGHQLRHRQAAVPLAVRSEERRVGKECVIRVDIGGRRNIKK